MLAGAISNVLLLTTLLFATGITPGASSPTIGSAIGHLVHGDLSNDCILLPTWIKRSGTKGKWHLRLRGYVLEMHEKPGVMFGSIIGMLGVATGTEHNDEMKKRLKYAYSSLRSEPVTIKEIQITEENGKSTPWLPLRSVMTDKDAMFRIQTDVELSSDAKPGSWVKVSVRFQNDAVKKASAQLVDDQGWTIVSDIDDTVKDSRVLQKPEALKRLFYLPNQPVKGMPEFYDYLFGKLASPGPSGMMVGPTFQYLTASPFELHPNLKKFLKEAHFPKATVTPSPVRLQYFIQQLGLDLRKYKSTNTGTIIKNFPSRKFILVGDSGQMDPEAYADAMRASPEATAQVQCILIRLVTGQNPDVEATKNTKARFNLAFQNIPPTKWRVFADPLELMAVKFDEGACYAAGQKNEYYEATPSSAPPANLGTVDGGKESIMTKTQDGKPINMVAIGAATAGVVTGAGAATASGTAAVPAPAPEKEPKVKPVQVVTLTKEQSAQVLGF